MNAPSWRPFMLGVLRVFLFSFVGTFLAGWQGVGDAPDWNTAKAAAVALIVGALSAGVKAVVDAITTGKTPFPGFGILSRKTAP